MSPVRNVSAHLGDVMRRSETRGAQAERARLTRRAQELHVSSHHDRAARAFAECPEPSCQAMARLLDAGTEAD